MSQVIVFAVGFMAVASLVSVLAYYEGYVRGYFAGFREGAGRNVGEVGL